MGCDIHGLCEVKQNGIWKVNTDKVFPNPYYNAKPEYDWQKEEFDTHPDSGRNYDWFAILADVRNGRGFAGIRTGDGFAIIDEPRGVPNDATEEWMEEVKGWRNDMHSHSWLRVQDFNDFDWTQTTLKRGIISLEEYKKLGRGETPKSWSGGISGPKVVIVEVDEANAILKGETVTVHFQPAPFLSTELIDVNLQSDLDIHVEYEWEIEYWDWFNHKFKTVIKPMQELAQKYEDVRYVFGFDN